MPLDEDQFYAEACESLRHYSNSVKDIRTVTIAQGFIVLSATLYLIRENQFPLSSCVSFFGILLTAVLHGLQSNYWHQFDDFLQYIIVAEQKGVKDNSALGPWSTYGIHRNKRFAKRWYRLRVKHGPYILLLIGLLLVLIYSIANL